MPDDEMYDQLIAINQRAFAEGDYDTACHALESALTRAHYLQDIEGLSAVSTIARKQESQLASLPLLERIPGTSDHVRRALRLVLATLVAEVPTMTSLIQHERHLAQRRLPREAHEADR